MESIEGALGRMSLSVAEKKGVRVKGGSGGKAMISAALPIQAVAKLLSEKAAHPESLEQALGRIWCPSRGIECKGLGENKFLEEAKSLDEIEFNHIPIWIQVSNLPMGMMNAETAEAIREEIGESVTVETDDGKNAAGRFLRLKVKIDIRKPAWGHGDY